MRSMASLMALSTKMGPRRMGTASNAQVRFDANAKEWVLRRTWALFAAALLWSAWLLLVGALPHLISGTGSTPLARTLSSKLMSS